MQRGDGEGADAETLDSSTEVELMSLGGGRGEAELHSRDKYAGGNTAVRYYGPGGGQLMITPCGVASAGRCGLQVQPCTIHDT